MSSLRSFVSLVVLCAAATGSFACKKDEPKATAEPSPSASGQAKDKSRLNIRNPMQPTAKVDPQTMKEYRMDVCYFGSLTLKQARDAYQASLGKDEPSEKKLPNFGGQAPPKPGDAKSASAAATAAPAVKPPAAPSGAASAGARPGASAAGRPDPRMPMPGAAGERDPRRPFDIGLRAPHERNARACTVAAGHKDPAMPEVDAAVGAFAPYAVELAKNIAAAQTYYQREDYKKDSFAKGKELHKKLVEDFGKLDELSDKLGAAVEKWRKEHPSDPSKLDEPAKLARAAFDDARGVMLAMLSTKKLDKALVEKSDKAAAALKDYGAAHATDPWAKILNPTLEGFSKAVKEASEKAGDKAVDNDGYLSLVNAFTAIVEAHQRAVSRALIAKSQEAAAASGAPSAAPPPPEHKE